MNSDYRSPAPEAILRYTCSVIKVVRSFEMESHKDCYILQIPSKPGMLSSIATVGITQVPYP